MIKHKPLRIKWEYEDGLSTGRFYLFEWIKKEAGYKSACRLSNPLLRRLQIIKNDSILYDTLKYWLTKF